MQDDSRSHKAAERDAHAARLESASLHQALDMAKRTLAVKDQESARLQRSLDAARTELSGLQDKCRCLKREHVICIYALIISKPQLPVFIPLWLCTSIPD